MQKENKPKTRFLVNTVKGVTLGISVAIPGLSAGTIAVAEKCYDTIIDSIAGIRKAFKQNFLVLLPYLLGLLIGALAAFIGIQKGYKAAPFTITGAFAGLVLGSLPITFGELKKHQNTKELVTHVTSFALCLLVSAGLGIFTALYQINLETAMQNREWWIYLLSILSGIIGAFACVVPGISGSMSLMVIGMYFPILNTFATTKGELSIFAHTDDMAFVLTGILILVLLIIGALIGLGFSSKIMNKLLSNHRISTFYAILGLILGSVISMFINSNIYPKYLDGSIQTWDYITGAILLFVITVSMILFFLLKKKKTAQK